MFKLAPLSIALAVTTMLASAAGAGDQQKPIDTVTPRVSEYNETVKLSSGEVRKGEVCVTFVPEMQSGDFFEGLQRIDFGDAFYFRKNSLQVRFFPNSIRVEMHVNIHECDSNLYTPAASPDFVKGMKFRVQWKRDADLRPATYSVENVPLDLEEGDNRFLYVFRVRDSGVPLSDHLIISVWTDHGKLLSRMSARL